MMTNIHRKQHTVRLLGWLFLLLALGIISPRQDIQAASNTSGGYVYFSHSGGIYRMNTESGKVSAVKTLIKTALNPVRDISCAGKYLYFSLNYKEGSEDSEQQGRWICRMKKNGKGFTPLAEGFNPVAYGDYIYYIGSEYDPDTKKDVPSGIYRMKKSGKSPVCLIESIHVRRITVLKDTIYYIYDDGSSYAYVKSYHLSSKKRYIIYKDDSGFMNLETPDGKSLYVTTDFRGIYRYYPKKKLTRKYLPGTDGYAIHGVQNGYLYYSEGRTLKRMNVTSGAVTRIRRLKGGEPTDLVYGGDHWIIVEQDIASGKYTRAVTRLRPSGEDMKMLARWYEKYYTDRNTKKRGLRMADASPA